MRPVLLVLAYLSCLFFTRTCRCLQISQISKKQGLKSYGHHLFACFKNGPIGVTGDIVVVNSSVSRTTCKVYHRGNYPKCPPKEADHRGNTSLCPKCKVFTSDHRVWPACNIYRIVNQDRKPNVYTSSSVLHQITPERISQTEGTPSEGRIFTEGNGNKMKITTPKHVTAKPGTIPSCVCNPQIMSNIHVVSVNWESMETYKLINSKFHDLGNIKRSARIKRTDLFHFYHLCYFYFVAQRSRICRSCINGTYDNEQTLTTATSGWKIVYLFFDKKKGQIIFILKVHVDVHVVMRINTSGGVKRLIMRKTGFFVSFGHDVDRSVIYFLETKQMAIWQCSYDSGRTLTRTRIELPYVLIMSIRRKSADVTILPQLQMLWICKGKGRRRTFYNYNYNTQDLTTLTTTPWMNNMKRRPQIRIVSNKVLISAVNVYEYSLQGIYKGIAIRNKRKSFFVFID